MHVVIGVLTALAGLIWAVVALQKAGVTLSSFNPFMWQRRMAWKKNLGEKPLYALSDPMEVAAVLILGVAKCEGEISAEQKRNIQDIYETDFRLGRDEAADLLLASSHLIRNEIYLVDNLDKILKKSQSQFKARQVESMLSMMRRTGALEGELNEEQRKIIAATESYFGRTSQTQDTW
jgi:hypothetical protein